MRSARKVQFTSTGIVPSQPTTPSKAAMNGLLTGFQALHETLRDNEVVTSIAEKFIRQYFILHSKEESLKKFDDDAYIPLSCRVKIDLKGSYRIRMSNKFADVRKELDTVTEKFQDDAAKCFLAAAELELDLIRSDLAEMAVKFADLLMKQKLLFKEDCRDHSKSSELITAVFIRDPTNHPNYSEMIVDTEETQKDLSNQIKGLRFGVDDAFIYKALTVTPDITGTQPSALHANEVELIMDTKKDLKNTLMRGMLSFHSQLRKVRMHNATKEVLLQSATIKVANSTAEDLNKGNGTDGVQLPKDAESLQDLIGAIVLDKLNIKKSKKQQKEVKEQRGAQRQGTQGGGASSNINATTQKKKREKLKKKKLAAAALAKKKKAGKAVAAAKDSVAANSNKRRRPPTGSK